LPDDRVETNLPFVLPLTEAAILMAEMKFQASDLIIFDA
jgi:hypothetical protein